MSFLDKFGRPGGGAPLRDRYGNVLTDIRGSRNLSGEGLQSQHLNQTMSAGDWQTQKKREIEDLNAVLRQQIEEKRERERLAKEKERLEEEREIARLERDDEWRGEVHYNQPHPCSVADRPGPSGRAPSDSRDFAGQQFYEDEEDKDAIIRSLQDQLARAQLANGESPPAPAPEQRLFNARPAPAYTPSPGHGPAASGRRAPSDAVGLEPSAPGRGSREVEQRAGRRGHSGPAAGAMASSPGHGELAIANAHCFVCGEQVCRSVRFSGRGFRYADDVHVHEECDDQYQELVATRCAECGEAIVAGARFSGRGFTYSGAGGEAVTVHEECNGAHLRATAPPCAHCCLPLAPGHGFSGKGVVLEAEGTHLHEECVAAYHRATAKHCAHCAQPIAATAHFSGRGYMYKAEGKPDGEVYVHVECDDGWHMANAPKCLHCSEPLSTVSDGYSGVRVRVPVPRGADPDAAHEVHSECYDAYKETQRQHAAPGGSTRKTAHDRPPPQDAPPHLAGEHRHRMANRGASGAVRRSVHFSGSTGGEDGMLADLQVQDALVEDLDDDEAFQAPVPDAARGGGRERGVPTAASKSGPSRRMHAAQSAHCSPAPAWEELEGPSVTQHPSRGSNLGHGAFEGGMRGSQRPHSGLDRGQQQYQGERGYMAAEEGPAQATTSGSAGWEARGTWKLDMRTPEEQTKAKVHAMREQRLAQETRVRERMLAQAREDAYNERCDLLAKNGKADPRLRHTSMKQGGSPGNDWEDRPAASKAHARSQSRQSSSFVV